MATEFQTRAEYEAFLKALLKEYPDTPLTDWENILIQTINHGKTYENGETVRERTIDYYGGGPITVDGEEYSEAIPPEHILELHGEDPDNFDVEHLNSRAADHLRMDLDSLEPLQAGE